MTVIIDKWYRGWESSSHISYLRSRGWDVRDEGSNIVAEHPDPGFDWKPDGFDADRKQFYRVETVIIREKADPHIVATEPGLARRVAIYEDGTRRFIDEKNLKF